jgi:hypothetical protein
MQKGPDVNMQNSLGNNSIMCMVEKPMPHGFDNSFNQKHKDMITIGEILLENNVDTDIKNEKNNDAYKLAYNNGYNEFALMIRDYNKYYLRNKFFSSSSRIPFASNHPAFEF